MYPWNKGLTKETDVRLEKIGNKTNHPIPWNKDTKGIMKPNSGSFKKGQLAWNEGLECRWLYTNKHGFKKCHTPWNKGKEHLTKHKHPQWKGGVTPENEILRHSVKYKQWRKAVFERDNYTCQDCGKRGCILEANHQKRWADYPESRFDINNGETLCQPCHHKETWGW